VAPLKKPAHRLSDNSFKLQHDEWIPQILDDPRLPALILEGGRQLPLKYTRKRDEVVTWLLFETGARVSEVTGLMLGDWAGLGAQTKARAFNKGSFGRRTKVLSFHEDTVLLLRRYFDAERIRFDPNGSTLDEYLLQASHKQVDLQTIPLFVTTQGTQLTPKAYREHYWNAACQAVGIEADVHQARHWLVTRSVRDIYETAKSKEEIERRLHGLIEYLKRYSQHRRRAVIRPAIGQRCMDVLCSICSAESLGTVGLIISPSSLLSFRHADEMSRRCNGGVECRYPPANVSERRNRRGRQPGHSIPVFERLFECGDTRLELV
jgi:integrase